MAISKIKVGNVDHEIKTRIPLVDGLQAALDAKADREQGIYYIEGSGTTDSTNKVATWLGTHSDITAYYSGLTVAYKVATAGSSTTTLNINNLGAVTVVRNATTDISTACPVNGVILLTYTTDDDGTSYWKTADYDSNTKYTAGTYNKTGAKMYITGVTSQGTSSTSSATTYTNKNVYIGKDNCLYSNNKKVLDIDHITAPDAHEDIRVIVNKALLTTGGTMTGNIFMSNGAVHSSQ